MRELRALVVGKFAVPGAVTQAVIRVAKCLRLSGFSVDLAFLRGSTGEEAAKAGLQVYNYKTGPAEKRSIRLGLPLLRIALRDGFSDRSSPDVTDWVLAPFLHNWASVYDFLVFGDELLPVFGVLYTQISKVPYFVIAHEDKEVDFRLLRPAQRLALRNSLGIFVLSPLALSGFGARGIRNVRMLGLAEPVSEIELEKEGYVLFDTRWTPKRRPEFVLELLRACPLAKGIMAGSFPSLRARREFDGQLASSGLANRFTFCLNSAADDLDKLYHRASAYVRWPEVHGDVVYERGIGWGVIRALERGCPVVLDRRLGGSGYIEDGKQGFLVGPDVSDFSAAIQTILTDNERRKSMSLEALALARRISTVATSVGLREYIESRLGM